MPKSLPALVLGGAIVLAGGTAFGLVGPASSSAAIPKAAAPVQKGVDYFGQRLDSNGAGIKLQEAARLIAETAPLPSSGAYSVHATGDLELWGGASAECLVAAVAPVGNGLKDDGDHSNDVDGVQNDGALEVGHADRREAVVDDVVRGVKANQRIGLYCYNVQGSTSSSYALVHRAFVEALPLAHYSYHNIK